MTRLPVGSLVWLYEPPHAPVEGMITGYVGGQAHLQVHRKHNPTPLVSVDVVYARLHHWRRLVSTLRQDGDTLHDAADRLEAECAYRKTEEPTP